MVSRPFFAPFFDAIENVEFFPIDLDGRHKGIFGLARLYSDLRKKKVDAIADLHNVLRSKILRLFFVGGTKPVAKIDKGRNEKKALTRTENKIFKPLKSTFERYADVFRELGFTLDLLHPEFPAKAEVASDVKSVSGEKTSKWIGIAPFAKHAGKQYPQDLMAEIVSGLSQNPDCKIFLFGAGAEEMAILNSFTSDKQNVVVVAGKLKLKQELNLIANLDLMLSMDSGNAHMAAMLGIPTITLWGATHPFAGFAPFGQPESNQMLSDREMFPLLPTSVYGNKIVEGYQDAMRTISPLSVVEKINSLLK